MGVMPVTPWSERSILSQAGCVASTDPGSRSSRSYEGRPVSSWPLRRAWRPLGMADAGLRAPADDRPLYVGTATSLSTRARTTLDRQDRVVTRPACWAARRRATRSAPTSATPSASRTRSRTGDARLTSLDGRSAAARALAVARGGRRDRDRSRLLSSCRTVEPRKGDDPVAIHTFGAVGERADSPAWAGRGRLEWMEPPVGRGSSAPTERPLRGFSGRGRDRCGFGGRCTPCTDQSGLGARSELACGRSSPGPSRSM